MYVYMIKTFWVKQYENQTEINCLALLCVAELKLVHNSSKVQHKNSQSVIEIICKTAARTITANQTCTCAKKHSIIIVVLVAIQ